MTATALRKRTIPRQSKYAPKLLDPGQPIEWTRTIPGLWTGETWGEGEWIPSQDIDRTGTVWSVGPTASSRWVIPDDAPGGAVLVFLPGKRDREWGRPATEDNSRTPSWQRDAVRRADHVRAMGTVFAVVEGETDEYPSYWNGYNRRTRKTWSWHCDPECTEIAGKDRDEGAYPEFTVGSVVDVLTGRTPQASEPPFCKRCIYLQH